MFEGTCTFSRLENFLNTNICKNYTEHLQCMFPGADFVVASVCMYVTLYQHDCDFFSAKKESRYIHTPSLFNSHY